jgi:hypothetical protein
MCVACPIFYLRRARAEFNWLVHLVLPAIGLAGLLPTMFFSVQGLNYPANLALPVLAAWTAVGIAVLIWLRLTRVDISSERQRWLQSDDADHGLTRV